MENRRVRFCRFCRFGPYGRAAADPPGCVIEGFGTPDHMALVSMSGQPPNFGPALDFCGAWELDFTALSTRDPLPPIACQGHEYWPVLVASHPHLVSFGFFFAISAPNDCLLPLDGRYMARAESTCRLVVLLVVVTPSIHSLNTSCGSVGDKGPSTLFLCVHFPLFPAYFWGSGAESRLDGRGLSGICAGCWVFLAPRPALKPATAFPSPKALVPLWTSKVLIPASSAPLRSCSADLTWQMHLAGKKRQQLPHLLNCRDCVFRQEKSNWLFIHPASQSSVSTLFLPSNDSFCLMETVPPHQSLGRVAHGSTSNPNTVSWNLFDSFQIQISQPTGKTIMQWVCSTDLVLDLKMVLERRSGIPSGLQRLLFQGKQLDDLLPISSYSINRNSSLVLTLRLRGGAAGQSSTAPPFSYKDAVHSEIPKPSEALKPKPFLVNKTEEVPSVDIAHADPVNQLQEYAERALICRFNGLWPRSQDLYDWVHANWTHHCKVSLCSKGYFIVLFDDSKHYEKALEEGPWFLGTAGLFLTPWFPDFDPATAVITRTPVWIRLPNLPVHLWHVAVYKAIGNTLGSFITGDYRRERVGLYTYARFCVEVDLSKGLPDQIILKINDFVWTQTLDYENTAFRCRHCHQTGHLQSTCPSLPAKKKKENLSKHKSKRWAPCSPPPVMDSDSSCSEDDASDADLDQAPPAGAPSNDGPAHSSGIAIAQKRAHLTSSSDSEKEGPPSGSPSLQVIVAHSPLDGWVKVKNRKGKKLRVMTSTHSG